MASQGKPTSSKISRIFHKTGGQSVVKQKREILGPAFDHGGGCAVHARAQGVWRIAKAQAHFAPLREKGEFHIFKDAVGDRGVAAKAPVGFTLDEQELAVGRGDALVGIGDLGGRIGQSKFREDERHQRALRKPGDNLARRIAQHSGFVASGFVHRAVQVAGLVDRVRVGEQKPAAARFAGSGPDGIVLPCPAFFELGGLKDGDPGKAAGNFGGAVGGVVVDDDQFPVATELEDVFGLRDERLQAGCKVLLFVAGRNDDGEFDEFVSGSGWSKTVPVRTGMARGSPGSSERPRTGLNVRPAPLTDSGSAGSGLSAIAPRPFFQYPSLRIIRMCGFLVSLPLVPFSR